MPARLPHKCKAGSERNDTTLAHAARRWGLDWEIQILGKGQKLPVLPYFVVGDALVIEVPLAEEQGEYKFITSVHMDSEDVLAKPMEVPMVPRVNKKNAVAAAPSIAQLVFVAQKEGRCELFVDVSWEPQEEALASKHWLCAPAAVNSVARIGPLHVEVQKKPADPTGRVAAVDGPQTLWWNGARWSAKRAGGKRNRFVPMVNGSAEKARMASKSAPQHLTAQPPQTARPQSARPTPTLVNRPNSAGSNRPSKPENNTWQTPRPKSAARAKPK